jgi:hypothetical protein
VKVTAEERMRITAVIVRLVDCVEVEGEQLVPSSCPSMMTSLRRQRRRVTETISRLEASRQALDSLLTTALRPREPHR